MPAPLTKAISRGGVSTHSQPPAATESISNPLAASTSHIQSGPSWPKLNKTSSEEQASTKASLRAWWASFTKPRQKKPIENKVFGVPLRQSLKYASVAISVAGDDGQQYVWGYVPVIVAKVGLYLKENATEVEGVFRIAGSQKRMKELQDIFDTPPRYGKSVDWTKYSVHDAASVLRRYFNHMPEPIVPHDLYTEFRNVMAKKPFDQEGAIKTYRLLISSMSPASQYLLLYVLDLLAVFARKSDKNRMPASNLAVMFQPGMFSHPSHVQSPIEHKLAVQVLEMLINHQDQFVLGMQPQPSSTLPQEELTAVSKPVEGEDLLEPSDSDEDQGELVVHEGGGANLYRIQSPSKSKTSNVKRFSAGLRTVKSDASSDEDETPGAMSSEKALTGSTGLRRSRTAPSRKMVEVGTSTRKFRRPRGSTGNQRLSEEEEARIVAALIPPPPAPKSASMQKAASSTGEGKSSKKSLEVTGTSVRKSTSSAGAASTMSSAVPSEKPPTSLPSPPNSKISPVAESRPMEADAK